MAIKPLHPWCMSIALVLTASTVDAIPIGIINNGSYTTDTSTGLDWLDLSITTNQNYLDVSAGFGTFGGGGWRYATNLEVENLVGILFPTLPPTTADLEFNSTLPDSEILLGHNTFTQLFNRTYNYDYYNSSNGDSTFRNMTLGTYLDEDGELRKLGVAYYSDRDCYRNWKGQRRCGTDYTYNFYGLESNDVLSTSTTYGDRGVFLVRGINSPVSIVQVPEPSILALLGLGLAGIGIMRRKRTA